MQALPGEIGLGGQPGYYSSGYGGQVPQAQTPQAQTPQTKPQAQAPPKRIQPEMGGAGGQMAPPRPAAAKSATPVGSLTKGPPVATTSSARGGQVAEKEKPAKKKESKEEEKKESLNLLKRKSPNAPDTAGGPKDGAHASTSTKGSPSGMIGKMSKPSTAAPQSPLSSSSSKLATESKKGSIPTPSVSDRATSSAAGAAWKSTAKTSTTGSSISGTSLRQSSFSSSEPDADEEITMPELLLAKQTSYFSPSAKEEQPSSSFSSVGGASSSVRDQLFRSPEQSQAPGSTGPSPTTATSSATSREALGTGALMGAEDNLENDLAADELFDAMDDADLEDLDLEETGTPVPHTGPSWGWGAM